MKRVKKTLKPRRSQNWMNKKYSVAQIAKQAWRGVKYMKQLINVEKKFFDNAVDTFTPAITGQVLNLSSIAQGNDYNNRDGISVLLQSMLLRLTISASGIACDSLRMLIFQDNDQRGTDPVTADLFEDTTNGLRLSNSPLLHTVNKRFNVLMDQRIPIGGIQLTATQAAAIGPAYKHIKKFKKFKDSHIKFTGTTGADAGQYEGALYIYLQTITANCFVSYNCRLRYTDN